MATKLIIEYDAENGDAIPDGKAMETVLNAYKLSLRFNTPSFLKTSSENVVLAARVAIKEGKFSHEKVEFRYKQESWYMDKDGRNEFWPVGFCDTCSRFLERLLLI